MLLLLLLLLLLLCAQAADGCGAAPKGASGAHASRLAPPGGDHAGVPLPPKRGVERFRARVVGWPSSPSVADGGVPGPSAVPLEQRLMGGGRPPVGTPACSRASAALPLRQHKPRLGERTPADCDGFDENAKDADKVDNAECDVPGTCALLGQRDGGDFEDGVVCGEDRLA